MKKEAQPVSIELRAGETQEVGEITPEMLRNIRVAIGGKEFPLWYDMAAQLDAEEQLGLDFTDMQDVLNKKKGNTRAVIRILAILGNRGLIREGREPFLDEKWLTEHIVPASMRAYKIAALAAITSGWFMETDNGSEEERDIGLEEIRKKNGKTI